MTVNYYLARLRTRKAGAKTAEFIDWLHENTGMAFETLHVIGLSLGAHVAGFARKTSHKRQNQDDYWTRSCNAFVQTEEPTK